MRNKKLIALVVLVTSSVSFSQPKEMPSDIPLAVDPVSVALTLRDGSEVISQGGLYLNEPGSVKVGQSLAAMKAENASLRASLQDATSGVPLWVVLLLVAGAAGTGAIAAALVGGLK